MARFPVALVGWFKSCSQSSKLLLLVGLRLLRKRRERLQQHVPVCDGRVVTPFELFMVRAVLGVMYCFLAMLSGHLEQLLAFAAFLVVGKCVFMTLERLFL